MIVPFILSIAFSKLPFTIVVNLRRQGHRHESWLMTDILLDCLCLAYVRDYNGIAIHLTEFT